MREDFQKSKYLGANLKVKLDLSNYATKAVLKNEADVNISKFAKKVELASLKSEVDKLEKVPTVLSTLKSKVDKLDVNKLVPVPLDLSKLNDVVKSNAVKKTEYHELVKKVNTIQTTDTRNLVKKTDYDTKISEIEKKLLIIIIARSNYYTRI